MAEKSWCYCGNAGGYRHEPTDACRRDTPTAIYPDRYNALPKDSSVFITNKIVVINWMERAERAEKELARLRAAAKPFAALAEEVDRFRHKDDSTCPHRLRAGDIRALRAALEPE